MYDIYSTIHSSDLNKIHSSALAFFDFAQLFAANNPMTRSSSCGFR